MKGELIRIWYDQKSKRYVPSERFILCEWTNLVFDTETKIVYYQFNGYMTPYISENGKYCRFVDEQIVEIG